MFYYYFDRYYWILIVPAMLFAMWAQTKVNSTYNRYNRVYSARGMSAAQVCRQILDENGCSISVWSTFGQAERPL